MTQSDFFEINRNEKRTKKMNNGISDDYVGYGALINVRAHACVLRKEATSEGESFTGRV